MITLELTLDPTGWLEATWSDVTTVSATDESTEQVTTVPLYCQSYHPTQIQMLRDKAAEFSTDLSEHEQLLTQWVANYVPEPAPVKTITELQNEARLYLNSTDWYFVRLAETGDPVPEGVLAKRAEARAVLQ